MLALCFSVLTLFASPINGLVVCKENGESVSYSSIYLQNQRLGVYADSLGHFQIPDEILNYHNDTLIFSSVGFEQSKIAIADLKNVLIKNNGKILIKSAVINLKEIVVERNKNVKPIEYGFYKMKSSILGLTGNPGSLICIYIKNDDGLDRQIQSINIKIRKKNINKGTKLRVYFYTKTNCGFEKNNLLKNDIIIQNFSKDRITINLTDYNLTFPKEGIYIGVEWLMDKEMIIDFSKKTELSILCSNNVKENNTWVFTNKMWELFPDKKEFEGLPKFLRKKVEYANAQIGIVAF